ncbi:MAG: hypothetical protein JST82_04775 [Bacteroidetes bacterium]|nr:hypothetical protein [Bacteroidota bacterium]
MANKKNQRALSRMRQLQAASANQTDQTVVDTVLSVLYNNSDKDSMHLEKDIYRPLNIKLSNKDAERVWEILFSSGWINPVVGFGNSGKVELTSAGYQLMSQYGSYSDYLASIRNNQPQTIILPLQMHGMPATEPNTKKPDKDIPKPPKQDK